MVQFVQKRLPVPDGEVRGSPVVDSAFSKSYPALHEYLTLDWIDGQRRETSTLGISIDAGRWRGSLRDRDNGLVLWRSADGFDAVLGALERALVNPSEADWREDRYSRPKRKSP